MNDDLICSYSYPIFVAVAAAGGVRGRLGLHFVSSILSSCCKHSPVRCSTNTENLPQNGHCLQKRNDRLPSPSQT